MQSKICQAFICYNFDILMIMIMKTQKYFFSVFLGAGGKTKKLQKVGKDIIGTLGHW